MLTKDENIVDVTVSAQYRIANLKDFVLNVKDPEGSLRNAIESALRHVVGDNTLDQTLTVGRENIAFDVQTRLQTYLDSYQTGLLVQQVNIEKTDPPSAVKDAFDDVVAAREDKERLSLSSRAATTSSNASFTADGGSVFSIFTLSLIHI